MRVLIVRLRTKPHETIKSLDMLNPGAPRVQKLIPTLFQLEHNAGQGEQTASDIVKRDPFCTSEHP